MAIDIVGHLNDEVTSINMQQKIAMLEDLCEVHGYEETMLNEAHEEIPNPETKKMFGNRIIVSQIKRWVNNLRTNKAKKAVIIEELELT